MTRTIIHVDMDAFYASIEQRDDPSLAGKPVIVGGVTGRRGVVSAAPYEARRYGVRSAMPVSRARRLCPEGIYLSGDMAKYRAVSDRLHAIFSSYTPLMEPLSLDEAFLDVTAVIKLCGGGEKIGREIKDRVRADLDLTASVGVAPNKFLAKMASDHDKPDGLVVIKPGDEAKFLFALPVSSIHGVGKVTGRRMAERGIGTIGRLAEISREELRRLFGKQGDRLHELSHGIDESEVVAEAEAKSISHETTFDEDVADEKTLRKTLSSLSDRVGVRLRQEDLVAGVVGVKTGGTGRRSRRREGSARRFHDDHQGADPCRTCRRGQLDLLDGLAPLPGCSARRAEGEAPRRDGLGAEPAIGANEPFRRGERKKPEDNAGHRRHQEKIRRCGHRPRLEDDADGTREKGQERLA